MSIKLLVGATYASGDKKFKITRTFKSLFIGENVDTGEELSFYNTGECASLGAGWLKEIKEEEE